mmetsp:Transcript_36163/g.119141  ORF Transcript_36163/g.119141 Transcript_36163/m.119141 type:complete len:202 (-) Transcript_36163:423-1028(-)
MEVPVAVAPTSRFAKGERATRSKGVPCGALPRPTSTGSACRKSVRTTDHSASRAATARWTQSCAKLAAVTPRECPPTQKTCLRPVGSAASPPPPPRATTSKTGTWPCRTATARPGASCAVAATATSFESAEMDAPKTAACLAVSRATSEPESDQRQTLRSPSEPTVTMYCEFGAKIAALSGAGCTAAASNSRRSCSLGESE